MICVKKILIVTGLLALNTGAIAATAGTTDGTSASAALDEGWQSNAEVGIIVTSGNTKTSSLNSRFDSNKEVEKWRYNLHAEALSNSSGNIKSAEKYLASGQSNYKFNKFDYMFGLLMYSKDLFSGYQYQTTLAAGYGHRLLNDDTMTLDLEVGPGVRFEKVDTSIDPAAKAKTNAILRMAAKYRWEISGNAKFSEDLTSEASHESSVAKSVTGLTTKVNSSLAMKVTVTLTRTTHVPAGTKENDTETALTLVYSF